MAGLKDQFYGDDVALYPRAPGFQRRSDTSRAAAHSMRPHFTHQQQTILDFLQGQGERGATYAEICTRGVGKADHTICPRCHGYGSVGLSVIMRSKAATMRGDGALPKAKGGV